MIKRVEAEGVEVKSLLAVKLVKSESLLDPDLYRGLVKTRIYSGKELTNPAQHLPGGCPRPRGKDLTKFSGRGGPTRAGELVDQLTTNSLTQRASSQLTHSLLLSLLLKSQLTHSELTQSINSTVLNPGFRNFQSRQRNKLVQ